MQSFKVLMEKSRWQVEKTSLKASVSLEHSILAEACEKDDVFVPVIMETRKNEDETQRHKNYELKESSFHTSDWVEKLPNIKSDEQKSVKGSHKIVEKDRKCSTPRTKSHSTNIPPLPSISEHHIAMKYPLASKYFKKWNNGTHHEIASSLMSPRDSISEEESEFGETSHKRAPLKLLTRFPSSPEFSAVLHDLFETPDVTHE